MPPGPTDRYCGRAGSGVDGVRIRREALRRLRRLRLLRPMGGESRDIREKETAVGAENGARASRRGSLSERQNGRTSSSSLSF